MGNNYRQGDVYILAASIPEKAAKAAPERDIVLALGEVTGHAHRIIAPGTKVSMWNVGTQRYMVVNEEVTLTHEEHGPITIPPGEYEVRIQRVYQPGGEIRQVAD